MIAGVLRFLLVVLAACWVAPLSAQQYPTKPVRLIVGQAPGGGVDTAARGLAAKVSPLIGQQMVVENRSGAAATIAADYVAHSAPDGYTLLYGETGILIAPSLYKSLNYDVVKSFTAAGGVGWEPFVLVVNPAVPAKNTTELIAVLKANPGKYSYGSAGIGSPHHLSMELLKKQVGVDAVHVPYKGSALVIPDVVSGILPMAFMSVAAALPQVKSGKLRVIGLSKPQKLASVPDWPFIADTLPGFDTSADHFILAPTGTSAQVIARLSDAFNTACAAEDIKQSFLSRGATAEFVPPATIAARIQSEVRRWGAIAKESGATLD